MDTLRAHSDILPGEWPNNEAMQNITWNIFRFRWTGLLIDKGLTQVGNRREDTLIDPATGEVTLTIEADVEPRT